jgi:hypothetical protein
MLHPQPLKGIISKPLIILPNTFAEVGTNKPANGEKKKDNLNTMDMGGF